MRIVILVLISSFCYAQGSLLSTMSKSLIAASGSSQITTIKLSGIENDIFRSDGPSALVLENGNIIIAYAGYETESVVDAGPATIFLVTSTNGGRTFSAPVRQFVSIGATGTYLPSLYQRDDGSVFMLVYVQNSIATSELWKVESNDGGATFSGTQTNIYDVPEDYSAPMSDRIFRTNTGRLLYPFNRTLTSDHSGQTGTASGKLLKSDDDGVTWSDVGVTINGINSVVFEPGIVQEYEGSGEPVEPPTARNLIMYFRNRAGIVGASRSLTDGDSWGTSDGIGLQAPNSASTIIYDNTHKIYYAAVNKYYPTDLGRRTILYLATSIDLRTWNYSMIVDYDDTDGVQLFEPIIYIYQQKVNVVYTRTNQAVTQLDLYQKSIPIEFITNSTYKEYDGIKVKRSFVVGTGDYLGMYNQNVSETLGYNTYTQLSGNGAVFGMWQKTRSLTTNWGYLWSIVHPANVQGFELNFSTDASTGTLTNSLFKIRNGAFSGSGGTVVMDVAPQYIKPPSGTTAQRPSSPSAGYMRYNTDDNKLEYYNGTTWIQL